MPIQALPIRFDSLDDLRSAGFSGFDTVAVLVASRLKQVPEKPGIYIVARCSQDPPEFLPQSPAGHFKGRDPSVPLTDLRGAWVTGTRVLYIGKAGGTGKKSTLRSRLRAYVAHGAGRRATHWGGRYIWQLADSADLIIAWQVQGVAEPRDVERGLILQFEACFGAKPFANRVR